MTDGYLEWITGLIRDPKLIVHKKLIRKLYTTDFFVCDPNDQPREDDGYDLRWRYVWECDLPNGYDVKIPGITEERCSILEMMVALALRADENFTKSETSRVPDLFWSMVKSMGLLGETDNMFDEENVTERLDIFNNRLYDPNGHGGLFVFHNIDDDVRNISIWNQLCRWINMQSRESA